jgi:hypothetical protein
MDVSTAPHAHPEPNQNNSPVSLPPTVPTTPVVTHGRIAPVSRTHPILHGLMMGLATTISVAITICCLLSVANLLGPGRRTLNTLMAATCVIAGVYVGFRSWQGRSAPQPLVGGRCPDCGREYMQGQHACALCGRVVDGVTEYGKTEIRNAKSETA